MLNYKIIISLTLIFIILFFGLRVIRIRGTEGFENFRNWIITVPPNSDVKASPSPSAQTAQANSVYLASSPGTMPGGAELTQGTTAFLTNTPSRYVQQFASDTIVTNSQANAAYRTILNYLSQNPSNSFMFLKDIRSKFFKDNAQYKEDINFRALAASDNMIFN